MSNSDVKSQHEAMETEGHGHTPAAWTFSILMMVGALIASVAFPIDMIVLLWVGLGIMAVGAIAGRVMSVVSSRSDG